MRLLSSLSLLIILFACPALAQVFETPAREAYLLDLSSNTVLLDKNANQPFPPASMSKLMTAYVVFDSLKRGQITRETEFQVSEKAWRAEGSRTFLPLGARVNVMDLLRGMIIQSGNDASIALAEGVSGSEEAFAELMNQTAKNIGLTASTFRNATGLPDPEHRMTAHDLGILAQRLIIDFPEYYPIYAETSFVFNNITQENRNPLLTARIGADGLKTGHTTEAGYGLTGSAKQGDRRLVMVVTGLNSMAQRAQESERLMRWGFATFNSYKVFSRDEVVHQVPVWYGEPNSLALMVAEDVVITVPRTLANKVTASLRWQRQPQAPIAGGETLALLDIKADGAVVKTVPLIAREAVASKGFFSRISANLNHIIWGEIP